MLRGDSCLLQQGELLRVPHEQRLHDTQMFVGVDAEISMCHYQVGIMNWPWHVYW